MRPSFPCIVSSTAVFAFSMGSFSSQNHESFGKAKAVLGITSNAMGTSGSFSGSYPAMGR
jgi:hypothetical protein